MQNLYQPPSYHRLFESLVNSDRCKTKTRRTTPWDSLRALLIQIGAKRYSTGISHSCRLRALLIQIGAKRPASLLGIESGLRALLIQIGAKLILSSLSARPGLAVLMIVCYTKPTWGSPCFKKLLNP